MQLLPRIFSRPFRFALAVGAAMVLTLGSGRAFPTGPQSETFNASSADPTTWTVPAGVTNVTVEVWGGGGRGGTRSTGGTGRGGGGGGGAYSRTESQAVTPGQVLYLRPGLGSSTTTAGADSWVGTTNNVSSAFVRALGGNSVADNTTAGATGGAAASGIGTVRFSGGTGGSAVTGGAGGGGGGGSSAGTAANGNNGSGVTAGTAPTGGGAGGAGSTSDNVAGSPGGTPGGGGGGARRTTGTVLGGTGGNGRVVINYVLPAPSLGLSGVPATLLEGGVSQPITVRFLDAGGNPVTSATPTVVNLSATPSGGTFRDSGDTADITTLTIPAGQSEGTFRFVSSTVANYTLNITATGLTSASSPLEVIERPPLPGASQTFYLPLPESQVLQGLTSLAAGLGTGSQPLNPMQRYAGVTAVANGTIIFYDQMENGYEVDINNPASIYHAVTNPSGTQIWGDGDPSNGAPPGIPSDVINSGSLIILSNPVNTTNQPTMANPLFNGGDKIGASKPIAITTSLWASQSQTLFCDAVEVYDTFSWGTDYRVPVGQNIALTGESLQYVGASIMAGPGGASVQIDANADGSFESTVTLAEGQAHFIDGGLQLGARFVANNRVQVDLITGDVGANFESRWFRLLPTSLWTNSYFTPVSSPGTSRGRGDTSDTTGTETQVLLYNPGASAINVTYSRRNLTGATANVANNGTSYSPTVILTGSAPGNVYGPIVELNDDGTVANAPEGAWIGIVNRSASNTPSIESKVINARNAGAAAVIVVRNTESTSFETAGTATIPVVGMALSTGTALRNAGLGAGWVRVSGNQTSSTVSVPAGGFASQVLDNGYGARFHAEGGQNFYAVSLTDANGTTAGSGRTWDWGFNLLPQTSLTPQALVGLAFGRDPTSSVRPNENGSPVWVTTVGNPSGGNGDVTVYVDYDSDPATGPLIDPNGYRYDVALTLRELEAVKVFNPSGNQSGMLLYTLSPGVKLVVAWGQDTLQATAGQPGFDAGTGTPPLPQFTASKRSALFLDVDGDGFISPGDHIEYEVSILNISRVPVPDMTLQDTLPDSVTYLPNTTTFTSHTGATQSIPDNGSGNPFPLSSAITLPGTALPPGQSWSVKYRVQIKSFEALPSGTTTIINSAVVNSLIIDEPINLNEQQPLFGRIGDFVWVDTNGNGIQDNGEPGLNGVTVNLLDSNGNPVLDANLNPRTTTTVTNSGNPGFYQFTGVQAGTYILQFVTPSGYVFTTQNADSAGITGGSNSDPSVTTGRTVSFALAAGQTSNFVDAGMYQPGTISGTVRRDTTGNGVGDTAQSGVTVTLKDSNGNDIDSDPNTPGVQPTTTTTAGNGSYSFGSLPPGNYRVVQTVPGGFVAIGDADGGDFTVIGNVTPITIVSGSTVTGRDFDIQAPGGISGFVRADTTGDGNGDTAQSGVTVTLKDSNGDDIDSDPNTPGVQPTTTTTAGNGSYSFGSLPPGNYRVVQTVPGGFAAIADVDGGNLTVNGDVTLIGVLPGVTVTNQNFVNRQAGTITGTVRADTTGDGNGDTARPGVTLTLQDGSGNDIDSDPNTPGVQPTTTTTAGNGTYSFNGLAAGNYRVVQTVPGGYIAISDVDGGDPTVIGNVTPIGVIPGQTVSGRDFVVSQLGTISGFVRIDTTGDGNGDTAQSGVSVALLDASGNPVLDGSNNPITTTTAGNGSYSFANVPSGNYRVAQTVPGGFTAIADVDGGNLTVIGDVTLIGVLPGATVTDQNFVNRAPGAITGTVRADTTGDGNGDTPQSGVTLTLRDGSGNDIDSDPNTPGVQPTTATTVGNGSYSFSNLPPGDYRVVQTVPAGYLAISDVDGGDPAVIGNVTAIGLIPGQTVSGRDFVIAQPGSISGKVWLDTNNDDEGDTDLGGVTLTLVDANGNPVLDGSNNPVTTVSAGDGTYSFTNLPPGTYGVGKTNPPGYVSVKDSDGGNPDQIRPIVVLPGQNNGGNEFVLRQLPGTIGGRVLIDTNLDGTGDTPLANVTLTLVNAAGDPILDGGNPVTTVTAGDGTYSFSSVVAGTYGVRATPVEGYLNIGDKDGTDFTWIGDVTDIVLPAGGESLDNDFLLRTQACPNTFADWQAKWGDLDVADLTPAGNNDGDIHNNLIEYAFCLDPKSGRGTPYCMSGSLESTEKVDLVFRRTAGGPLDITFELEHAATLGATGTTWTTAPIPPANIEVTRRTNGTDSVRVKDLEAITGLTAGTGFIRVKVTLRDQDDNVVATASTDVGGWIESPLDFEIRSFNDPFLDCPLFTGTVTAIEGQDIVTEVSGGNIDYGALLAGQTAYAEILTGPLQGHRFDIGGGGTNRFTAVVDNDVFSGTAPFSTVASPQPALVGAQFVVRPHRTVGSVFQQDALVATDDPETASIAQMYAGDRWVTLWLYNDGGEPGSQPAWVAVGDAELEDRSGDVLVPGQGGFIYSRKGEEPGASFMLFGKVRPNDFIRPIKAGLSNVGGGYPLMQSPDNRAMTPPSNGFQGNRDWKAADQFLLWRGDKRQQNNAGYDTYFMLAGTASRPLPPNWAFTGDVNLTPQNQVNHFKPDHSILLKRNNARPDNRMPSPWRP